MNSDEDAPPVREAGFHPTHWTLVLKAAQSNTPGAAGALGELCQLYWYPLYVFARRRGRSPDDAKDLTQGSPIPETLFRNTANGGSANRDGS